MQTDNIEPRFFISYARADGTEAATKVSEFLGKSTMGRPWRDEDDLVAGREFPRDIEDALIRADAVVLIATPRAVTSSWVRREIQFARNLQKRVIPLRFMSADLPQEWHDFQSVDFQSDDRDQALAQLVRAVRAVWKEVSSAVASAEQEDVDGVFTRVFDRLKETMTTLVRPPYSPEVPLLCLHIIDRLKTLREQRGLIGAADELQKGLIVLPESPWITAYQTHKKAADHLFRDFLKGIERPPVKTVTLVLAVMTATEAVELSTREAFGRDDAVLRKHFEKNVFPRLKRDVPDWQERYGERPELWRPYGGRSLELLVQQWFNDYAEENGTAERIGALFIDIRKLIDESRRTLRQLRKEGCELIVDAVSLCHPRIFAEYRRSALDVLPTTRVARVASLQLPVFPDAWRIPIQQHIDSYFYERQNDGDPSCDTAGTEPELRRWTNVIAEAVSPRPAGLSRQIYRR